jgi:hypothetical protein
MGKVKVVTLQGPIVTTVSIGSVTREVSIDENTAKALSEMLSTAGPDAGKVLLSARVNEMTPVF